MIRKRAARSKASPPPPADPRRLIRAQSVRGAIMAALIVIIAVTVLMVWLAAITGKFFPWFSVVQGLLIGLAVQRAGRGLDWRFPAIAGVAALLGAFVGNFVVAMSTTGLELAAGPLRILRGLTTDTWRIYFDEVVTPVDYIYAFFAAAVAAFYAKRRLERHEEYALRTMREEWE